MPAHEPAAALTRAEVDALSGATVLEFGTSWCGYCRRARSLIDAALAGHPQLAHLRIEDGPGKALGRSFRVKLWPTLIVLQDGREIGRVVRPEEAAEIADLIAQLDRSR